MLRSDAHLFIMLGSMKIVIVVVIVGFIVLGIFLLRSSKKGSTFSSVVGQDVAASLVRETTFPQPTALVEVAPFGSCEKIGVNGVPPQAALGEFQVGENTSGYKVKSAGGGPTLVFHNTAGAAGRSFDIWEIEEGATTVFKNKQTYTMELGETPKEKKKTAFHVEEAFCLPGNNILLVLAYWSPAVRHGLYVYDMTEHTVRELSPRIERDFWMSPFPPVYIDTLAATNQALLVRYHTDALRLAPEVYANQNDHVVLFSPQFPRGQEVLTLAVGDGSIRRWTMNDTKLWIEATDPREQQAPVHFVWSLDLRNVLAK